MIHLPSVVRRPKGCSGERRRFLAAGLALWAVLFGRGTEARARRGVQLRIASDGDLLAFKPDRLTCPTGARVHLVLYNTAKYVSQEHDWVLTVPGAADAVQKAALAAGERNGWVPRHDPRVLAATPVCRKGQHVSVDFIAPAPGRYPFLCTNPGHGEVMRGILVVTPDYTSR